LSHRQEILKMDCNTPLLKGFLEKDKSLFIREKTAEKKIVFTNGCFDILHPGHIRYLSHAASLGDLLVIGINSDSSVKRLKGESRPVNKEKVRAEMLLALSFVDHVVVFDEDTPYRIISEIKPDFLVKGGDWGHGNIVGEDLVKAYGGKVLSIPIAAGFSTTETIRRIFESDSAAGSQGNGNPENDSLEGSTDESSRASAKRTCDVLAVIPARWASTRLPGKPLCDICGKSMIQRVWERVIQAKRISRAVVATDDQRIYDAVNDFGGQAVMTSVDHQSGSDRAAEAARKWGGDIIVNVQGDEPFMNPDDIDLAVQMLEENSEMHVSTLAVPFGKDDSVDDPSKVKVVISESGRGVYFSRSTVPFFRDQTPTNDQFYRHLGLYAYRRSALENFVKIGPCRLEQTEKLEQLRFLANGYSIAVGITSESPAGIDTPEDLEKACEIIRAGKEMA
jgi:3-deoxy-manno-octulosonate cytidylyltransferase (CMP-KDO synthetase)